MADAAETPDTKPGNYYVTVVDGNRFGLLLGPYVNDHTAALERVEAARKKAEELDPRAWWYAYGTCRAEESRGPGRLNDLLPELAPKEV